MSRAVVLSAAARIADHARRHGLDAIRVVFHGGEPLLAGREHLRWATQAIRSAVGPTPVHFSIQTNGVLLDDPMLEALLAAEVSVGVSIDGTAETHDRRRPHAGGRGSHAEVAEALGRLGGQPYRPIFAGVLCTIDLGADPVESYEALVAFAPPTMDFLLPHGTWSHPPAGREEGSGSTPYADWLIALFDHWYARPRQAGIRVFDSIIDGLLGGSSRCESIGTSPVRTVTVETDGTIEQVDALKAAYDGAATTGFGVQDHSFDEVLAHPAILARQLGIEALSDACRRCDVVGVCGGGYYPHRHRRGEGYRNPSVYCPDLRRLIHHVAGRVASDLPRASPT